MTMDMHRRLRWVVLATLVGLLALSPAAGATVVMPPGELTVPSSGTFLYMNSQQGDYIGQGVEQLYTSADTNITGSLPQGGTQFSGSAIQGNYTHWWYVNIAAPAGQPLTVGSYTGAFRAPFRPDGSPGLDVYGDGRGCNTLTAQFDVNDIQYAPTGELLVFDATFEQHCEGGTPALFGRIRIENAPPPPDATPPTLLVSDVTVEAPNASGANVSYSATATDDRDPNPSVTCSPQSGSFFPVGTTTVNCSARDASGNVASGSFRVNVFAPLAFGVNISGQGMVTSKTGVATVSGTVSCSRAIHTTVSGTVKQLVANKAYVSGTFSLQVDCTAPTTSWSATLTGDNGKFTSGSANVTVAANGCELSCHSASAAATVRLNNSK
jgi:hypothetical protein